MHGTDGAITGVASPPQATPFVQPSYYWARRDDTTWERVDAAEVYKYPSQDVFGRANAQDALSAISSLTGDTSWRVSGSYIIRNPSYIRNSGPQVYISRYTSNDSVNEFRRAVKKIDNRGIDIRLDGEFSESHKFEDAAINEISKGKAGIIFAVEVDSIPLFCFVDESPYATYVVRAFPTLELARRKFKIMQRNTARREARSKSNIPSTSSLAGVFYLRLYNIVFSHPLLKRTVHRTKGGGKSAKSRYAYYKDILDLGLKLCTKAELKQCVPQFKELASWVKKSKNKNPFAVEFIAYATPLLLGKKKANTTTDCNKAVSVG